MTDGRPAAMPGMDVAPFIGSMEPETFLEASTALLGTFRELRAGENDNPAFTPSILADNLVETIVNTALTHVRTDTSGQAAATTAVQMLRGSGNTTARVHNLHAAISCAKNFHAAQAQFDRAPRSPVLSVFFNHGEIDPHHGITIQSAHSAAKPLWRNNPFYKDGGLPEIVIPLSGLTSPALGLPEQRAILDVREGRLDINMLLNVRAEEAIVLASRASLLTDAYEPQFLLPPVEGYEYGWDEGIGSVDSDEYHNWVCDELGIEGKPISGLHLLAVGDLAVQRLVMRLSEEFVPYMRNATPAGAPEAKRFVQRLEQTADAILYKNKPITLAAQRSIKEDVWDSLATDLRTVLQNSGVEVPAGDHSSDVPYWIKACHNNGIFETMDREAVARRVLAGVRQAHETDVVTAYDLLEAIEGELQQAIDFARVTEV